MQNSIKAVRKAKGVKQKELAARCRENGSNISASQICRYEKGDMPAENMTLKVAYAFAKALDCTIEDLFGNANEPEPKTEDGEE